MIKVENMLKGIIYRDKENRVKNAKGMVCISYLPIRGWQQYFLKNKHQNKVEAIEIEKSFAELGYETKTYYYEKNIKKVPFCDVVFGIEPNFEKIAKLNQSARKIYYATGSYWKYQNSKIIERTEEVRKKKGIAISYHRIVKENLAVDIADNIIQIGTNKCLDTYPENIRGKIIRINQSVVDVGIRRKDRAKDGEKIKYVWFGGKGSILKGLDLVLDYFRNNKDKTLYVCGAIEKDFIEMYRKELCQENIKVLGWVRVGTKLFQKVVRECSFCILPSVSEGCPGSVLTMAKCGVLPIATSIAMPDGLESCGFIMRSANEESIEEAIVKAESLSADELTERTERIISIVREKYNIEEYKKQFADILRRIL